MISPIQQLICFVFLNILHRSLYDIKRKSIFFPPNKVFRFTMPPRPDVVERGHLHLVVYLREVEVQRHWTPTDPQ